MDFPPAWTVLTSEEYETATPRITGDVSMEICAQLRPSGRILDNFRVSLGGSKILEYEADLGQLIPIPFFKGWRVKGQCWARDVAIRANIFSSGWIDLAATVGMREMEVFDKDGAGIAPASSSASSTSSMRTSQTPPASGLRSSSERTKNPDSRCRVYLPPLFYFLERLF